MYKKILGPLDGSKLSECSITHIRAIATGCQASEVALLMALEPVAAYPSYVSSRQAAEDMTKQHEEAEKQSQKKAEDYIAKVANSLKKDGIPVKNVIIPLEVNNGAAEAILDYAENNKVDLIVMSTHGRSGVTRWAFGSVADRVIRHSKIPVLTVTPAGCRE